MLDLVIRFERKKMNRQLLVDSYWTFVIPLICLFSLSTNMINIIVFRSIKSRNIIYKYMLVNSLADQIYLIMVVFVFFARCGQFCDMKDTYLAKFYIQYIFNYGANSVAFFSIFIEIGVMLQRFSTLRNKTFLKNTNKKLVLACLLIFCFLFHVPQLSSYEIRETNSTINSWFGHKVYERVNVGRLKRFPISKFLIFQVIVRFSLILVVVVLLNFLCRYLFKKYEAIQTDLDNQVGIATTSFFNQIQSPELGNT